jgi:hypothetical protein
MSLQMLVKTSPMDSEHPKTPSWAFSAPHLAKNSKSYAFCHFSPSSFSLWFAISHLWKTEPSFECFRCLNLAHTCVPQNAPKCRTVSGTKAPQVGGVGRMGAMWPRPSAKIGTCCHRSMDMWQVARRKS